MCLLQSNYGEKKDFLVLKNELTTLSHLRRLQMLPFYYVTWEDSCKFVHRSTVAQVTNLTRNSSPEEGLYYNNAVNYYLKALKSMGT